MAETSAVNYIGAVLATKPYDIRCRLSVNMNWFLWGLCHLTRLNLNNWSVTTFCGHEPWAPTRWRPPFMSVNGCVRCIPTRVGPGKIRAALWHLSSFGIKKKHFPNLYHQKWFRARKFIRFRSIYKHASLWKLVRRSFTNPPLIMGVKRGSFQ